MITSKCENCKCDSHCHKECSSCANDVCVTCNCENCRDEN